ncbi:class I SAM-dependent methyltransferase [Actinokineospora sp. HUAS TT18]|uniref:class I SAM-dependent methyltransferase n=1 Tax=Actinokineospora sp. HUAS TT18 TaxID=3447451 RepID=UPI003F51BF02
MASTFDDQYDDVASTYENYRDLPTRRVHTENFRKFIGDVSGLDVLDLAAGTGHFTAIIADGDPCRVVAVDISAGMIELARTQLARFSNVELVVQDVATMPFLGLFDVVTAELLLHYAPDHATLAAMCATISRHLKPGGRFTATIPNSHYDHRRPHDTRYGLTADWLDVMVDGTPYVFHVHGEPPVDIGCYYWSNETCVGMLAEAGCTDLEVTPLLPTPEMVVEFGARFWQPWIDSPWNVTITGRKAGGQVQ